MRFFKGIRRRGEDGRERWALMASYDIPCEQSSDGLYLRRLRIIATPWFGVFLHELRGADADRDLHDHPFSFISIILKGGYRELVPIRQEPVFRINMYRHWGRWSVHTMKATDRHRIVSLDQNPTWTLLLVGRRKRTWGFHTSQGFVPWDEYKERTDGNAIAG